MSTIPAGSIRCSRQQWRGRRSVVDQVSGKVASQNLAATKIKGRSSMSAGSAPTPISISTCTLRAAQLSRYFPPHHRGDPRDLDEVRKDIWGAGAAKAAIADRQVFDFADIGKAFSAWKPQALGKIRGDAVATTSLRRSSNSDNPIIRWCK